MQPQLQTKIQGKNKLQQALATEGRAMSMEAEEAAKKQEEVAQQQKHEQFQKLVQSVTNGHKELAAIFAAADLSPIDQIQKRLKKAADAQFMGQRFMLALEAHPRHNASPRDWLVSFIYEERRTGLMPTLEGYRMMYGGRH